jgi:hypothetical protein
MAEHQAYLEALRQTAVATGDVPQHDERKAAAQARRSPSVPRQARSTVTR